MLYELRKLIPRLYSSKNSLGKLFPKCVNILKDICLYFKIIQKYMEI